MSDSDNALSLNAQMAFLRSGGVYQKAVAGLPPYEYQEYPKAVRLNVRTEEVEEVTLDINGRERRARVKRTLWDEVVAHNEEEERQLMAGQPTARDLEDDRQELIRQAEQVGVRVDRRWGAERIRAEMEAAA